MINNIQQFHIDSINAQGDNYTIANQRFTVPAGEPTGRFFFNLQTLIGITRPTSGTNWGYLAIRKQNAAGNLTNNLVCEAYREVVSTSGVGTYVFETLNVTGLFTLSAVNM